MRTRFMLISAGLMMLFPLLCSAEPEPIPSLTPVTYISEPGNFSLRFPDTWSAVPAANPFPAYMDSLSFQHRENNSRIDIIYIDTDLLAKEDERFQEAYYNDCLQTILTERNQDLFVELIADPYLETNSALTFHIAGEARLGTFLYSMVTLYNFDKGSSQTCLFHAAGSDTLVCIVLTSLEESHPSENLLRYFSAVM